MKSQSGFTLIEMVAVIIILAIMAATALPKFTSLTGEARYASISGLQGGLRSAAALSKAKWLAAQSAHLNTVTFNGTGVSVIAFAVGASDPAAGTEGYPLNTSTGIEAAMDSLATYTSGAEADSIVWWPNGVVTSSNCYVKYQSGTVTIVPTTGATAAAACA